MILRILALVSAIAAAQLCLFPTVTSSAEIAAASVVSDLDNPSGVVVHPKTGHLFIAARDGIHRLVPGKPGKVSVEINGFKTDIYGKGPMYNIGPLGVAFLGDDHLIVGEGSLPDAQEVVRIFKIGAQPAAKPVAAESAVYTLGPVGPGEASAKGEGNFYGIAVDANGIYITSNGDDTKGWILRSEIKAGKPGELKPFIATKPLLDVDAPVAITMSPDGKQLVVGQMGEVNMAGDSWLTTYDPADGKLLRKAKTGLNDIAGLAFSPKTKKLYAVDFSWVDSKNGGLFELNPVDDNVKVKKILSLDKPTALAFDKEGNLYITVYGTAKDGGAPAGAVLRIEAGL
jgi:DNA-binding beta-propeller fold protein YncE